MKNSHTFFSYFGPDFPRTDLACEAVNTNDEIAGTRYQSYQSFGIPISELIIEKGLGEKNTGRKRGRYITLHAPTMRYLSDSQKQDLSRAVSKEIVTFTERITKKPISADTVVLVAGLGNRFISSDSIGPRTADKIAVTRHAKESHAKEIFEKLGCASISAVHPGVMGQTGIEAAAMIKGAAEEVRPDVIIAVDALAARGVDRLCATIQLCDSGIEPGSGIGNRRGAVKESTIGFPVIALGVPTVVDCATLVYDTLTKAGLDDGGQSLRKILNEERDFFVSPRDADAVAEEVSTILASAINRAFLAEGL